MDWSHRHVGGERSRLFDRGVAEGAREAFARDEFFQLAHGLGPVRCRLWPPHSLDEGVYFFAHDAFEGIAYRHVEKEIAGLPRHEEGEKVDRQPGVYVFLPGFLKSQLGGPLDIVPLIQRVDAGLVDIEGDRSAARSSARRRAPPDRYAASMFGAIWVWGPAAGPMGRLALPDITLRPGESASSLNSSRNRLPGIS